MNEYKGRMPTKIELELEQSQQDVSNDILVAVSSSLRLLKPKVHKLSLKPIRDPIINLIRTQSMYNTCCSSYNNICEDRNPTRANVKQALDFGFHSITKHDYTVINSPRAVMFRDKYGFRMMMRFNEIHKFSDGTLQQINEALDYSVNEFRINRMNPCLNTISNQEGRGSVQGVHVRYSEAFEDKEDLPQLGELCWWTR
uniref:MAK10-like protein n=1 Tax=Tanacetum cinerariifolium TaxID=118510 RepID=A0A6L2MH69_TANCI|nr:hypothetical protein [Tanacetum cinerariifolium]